MPDPEDTLGIIIIGVILLLLLASGFGFLGYGGVINITNQFYRTWMLILTWVFVSYLLVILALAIIYLLDKVKEK